MGASVAVAGFVLLQILGPKTSALAANRPDLPHDT